MHLVGQSDEPPASQILNSPREDVRTPLSGYGREPANGTKSANLRPRSSKTGAQVPEITDCMLDDVGSSQIQKGGCESVRYRARSVNHESFFFEHHVQVVHGPVDFGLLLRSRAHKLSRGEEKYHGLGVRHPVDQPRELLRLVH